LEQNTEADFLLSEPGLFLVFWKCKIAPGDVCAETPPFCARERKFISYSLPTCICWGKNQALRGSTAK